jgi:hypothetical protein
MQMQEVDIRKVLEEALEQLKDQDSYLFNVGANERSLTHKLAEYLQARLPVGWNVDCEYNRNQEDIKVIRKLVRVKKPESYDIEAKTVFPDIIVHKRGSNEHNLLVLEVKKSSSEDSKGLSDKEKLKALCEPPFKYKYAVFIRLIVHGANCPAGSGSGHHLMHRNLVQKSLNYCD